MVKPDLTQLKKFTYPIIKFGSRLKKPKLGELQKSGTWIFLFIVTLVVATQLTLAYKPIVGVYVDAAAITLLLGLAVIHEKARKLAISAAILPVTNLVLLTLPSTSTFADFR